MAAQSVFEPGARERVAKAVAGIEAGTAAEVVVVARRMAGDYRAADWLAGAGAAMVTLLVLLFHPKEFLVDTMPVDVLLGFAFGAVVSAHLPPLRRLLSGRKRMERAVQLAARAAFVDLGVSRTRGRTGILVLLAAFERRVEIVPDVGVDVQALGREYEQAVAAIGDAVRRGARLDAVVEALWRLAPPLARALPASADDVNELPDAMEVA
jgi:putative membrane protein